MTAAVSPVPAHEPRTGFDAVRTQLLQQFVGPDWIADSGMPVPWLEQQAERLLTEHADSPRVIQKAHLIRLVATRAQIAVDPLDWFVDKLNHDSLVIKARNRWLREAQQGELSAHAPWAKRMFELGVVRGGLDLAHICPGWEKLLRLGLRGLIAEAQAAREAAGAAATAEQLAFWEAVEIVDEAIIGLSQRFAQAAEDMAREQPIHASRLHTIAATCRVVPANPPETFLQALQFMWLMHEMVELEGEPVRSMGPFDQLLYPYYHADLDAGLLTRDEAKDLLKFFWTKWTARHNGNYPGSRHKNFLLGGQRRDGADATNDLTWLALEAYEELGVFDPKLSLRFHPKSPPELYRRIADLNRRGRQFMLMNDVPVLAAMQKRGKTLEDARGYVPIGCYEPAVAGMEVSNSMMIVPNLAKPVELALHNGVDPRSGEQVGPRTGDPTTFGEFEQCLEAYFAQLSFVLERSVESACAHERVRSQVNPSPVLAGTLADCLDRGKDLGDGGVHYHSNGCTGVGLANACDSLAALRQAVFEDKRCSLAELVEALDSDFEGREPLRLYLLNQCPKWGNDDPRADALARRLADWYCAKVHSFANPYGGPFQAALFSFTLNWQLGRNTGALPDGRRAGMPLATGAGAMAGRDRNGVTSLMNSMCKLDLTETPNGTVLDVLLDPRSVRGDRGLQHFVTLIKTFFDRGGYALQFNVVDPDTLRAAQRDPEQYQSLQVRVAGYSACFTTLSKAQQDHFIAQNAHEV